jgi:hypothetical protein
VRKNEKNQENILEQIQTNNSSNWGFYIWYPRFQK